MYVKTQWVDNTTPIDKNNLNKIEQGIYDNSLVVDAVTNTLNPTDTETYKTAELTEGQITDVIGVSDIVIKGDTEQDGTPTPSAPVDVNVVSGNNVINTSNKSGNLFNYDKWLENKTNFDTSDFKITKDCIVSIVPTRNDTDTLTPPMPTNPTASDIKTLQWMSFPVESDTDYTIILKNENLCTMQIVRFFYKENYSYINVAQSNFSSQYAVYTFKTTADTKFVSFRFDNESYSTTAKSLKISEIQLLKGIYTTSNIPAYEPYQGKELPLDLPVENLMALTNSTNTDGGITRVIENGVIKLNGTPQSTSYNNTILTFTATKTGQYMLLPYKSSTNSNIRFIYKINDGSFINNDDNLTMNLTKNDVVTINLRVSSTDRINNFTLKPMLYLGTKVNVFYPYGTDPIELCKIGDYQDYFYKSRSKWYLHKEVGKVVLDGTQTIKTLDTQSTNTSRVYYENIINAKSNNINVYANQLSGKFIWDTDENGIYVNSAIVVFRMSKNIIGTTIEEANTYLSSNNIILYYVLATATDTEITDTTLISQLEAIYNAPLYEETNITQTNNDLPMVLDITACKDNINGIKAFIRK